MKTPGNENETENKEASISNTSELNEAELDNVTGGTTGSVSIGNNTTEKRLTYNPFYNISINPEP